MKSGIYLRRSVASVLAVWAAVSPARLTQAQPSPPETAAAAPVDVPTAEPGYYLHRFEYDPPSTNSPKQVAVGGDFNQWSHSANPMVPDGAGHYVADVKLAEGPYAYRFYVDGGWVNDSASHSEADLEESNGIRGHNSAVVVGPDGRNLTPIEAGKIVVAGLHHVPGNIRYFDPISASEIRIAFGAQAGNLSSAAVYSLAGSRWRRDDLYAVETVAGISYFAGVALSQTTNLSYFFELRDGGTTGYYAGGKYFTSLAQARRNAWRGAMQPAFNTPDWAQHAVWYQIFPERFRNGSAANDPPNITPWTAWWTPPVAPARISTNGAPGVTNTIVARGGRGGRAAGNNRRYGGDIQGIESKLPYLRSLGVTCIYLNPIFKSPSAHKYDTSDYRHVDDNFGIPSDATELTRETEDPATWTWTKSDKLFLDFVAEAHRQGFKVVIDGVFNHSGTQFFPFVDLRRNGRNSKYADWYTVTGWDPLTWTSFGDSRNGNMPELKKDPITGLPPGPRDFVLNVTKRWLAPDGDPSRGVDGFRLDYAQNVPRVFWVTYRNLIKSIKPDAYITGEIWTPAPSYLRGDAWDATMQYPFANALQAFFVNRSNSAISASVFARQLQQLTTLYPFQVSLDQMNLVDSHDTERWASRFVNADRPGSAGGGGGGRGRGNYNTSKPDDLEWTRMKQSIAVQMTYVGSPMVYYGDEAGMWGGTDPDDRQPMIWKDLQPYDDPEVQFRQELFDYYVRLIALHRRLAALHSGFAHTVFADDARKILVYSRDLGDEHVYVLVNRSDQAQSVDLSTGQVDGNARLIDWLDATQAAVRPAPATPDGRPQLEAIPGAAPAVVVRHGLASINLKPWGAMILAPADAK
jgi:cyclomaltodextrinase / maltogenic alpha-amylase / neopullulanase